MKLEAAWDDILSFWMFDFAVICDDAALAIKLQQFHRLLHGSDPATPLAPPNTPVPAIARKRAFRSRSVRNPSRGDDGNAAYLDLADAGFVADTASFMIQHYGCLINFALEIKSIGAAHEVETETRALLTRITHELSARMKEWSGQREDGLHWLYACRRQDDAMLVRLAAHVPYDYLDRAIAWLDQKELTVGDDLNLTLQARPWNPQPRNPKARDRSRIKFHMAQMRELLAGVSPLIDHWAADGTRQPLRTLLGLQPEAAQSDRMIGKMVGASRSLGPKAQAAASANKMHLVSAFRDAAWQAFDTGWELAEHADRQAEAAERREQLRRAEASRLGSTPLADLRYEEEVARIVTSWPDDPRGWPRTWLPWWGDLI